MSRSADESRGKVLLPETAAVLVVRRAVRGWLARHGSGVGAVAVGLSGGADSLAMTAAAVAEVGDVDALIVDHRLQDGSAVVAETAAETALRLGCRSARVLPVDVGDAGGMEAAARRARYGALDGARAGMPVLLGHTLDDQAETVLLGLGRGSGARSIRGMAHDDPPWGRPLLTVRRADTRQCCADLALSPHDDPHNWSPEFTRVRLRTEVLPLLEEVLGGGAADALARTAEQLRADDTALDVVAEDLLRAAAVRTATGDTAVRTATGDAVTLSCETLATAPAAVRRRVLRAWLLRGGADAVTSKHLHAIDDLVVDWRGQGPVAVRGGDTGSRLVAAREHGRLTLALAARGHRDRRETS